MVRSVFSKYLEHQIFANLARWGVKLKALAKDPIRAAGQALTDTTDLFTARKTELDFHNEILIVQVGDKKTEINMSDTPTDPTSRYFEEKLVLGGVLENVITKMLATLITPDSSPNPSNSFKTCTLMYQTRLEGKTTILHRARNGAVSASSNFKHINFYYNIYLLLKSNTERIYNHTHQTPVAQPSAVSIRWSATDAPDTLRVAKSIVHRKGHLISLLIPTALSAPSCAVKLSHLGAIASILSKAEDSFAIHEPPKRDFSLEYVITTAAWQDRAKRISGNEVGDKDIEPLSQSPTRQLMGHRSQATVPDSLHMSTTARNMAVGISKKTQVYDSAMDLMKDWKITPTYIKVDCRRYVLSMIVIAVLIVLGGLAIPFSVQNRIRGVDPFNNTLFTWLFSVFFLVLAKSRYVSNWPSHDFLKGKMVCRSLSDSADVSGLDAQIIILYLLHKEWKTLLVTSGPYNGLFRRKCDPRTYDKKHVVLQTEEFSIDRPVALSTMYAAGFVILKVTTMEGEDLVCLDGRKGGWDYGNYGRKGNWMTCRNFNEDILEGIRDNVTANKEPGPKVLFLQRIEFSWNRVIGVYIKESHFG